MNALTMIFGEAMRNTTATVMPDEMKSIMAQLLHDLGHILRHRALGIISMVGITFRL